jgi:sugar/nucleoside kinase (ribokinase family)
MSAVEVLSPVDVLTFGEAMVAVRAEGPVRLGGAARLTIAGAESNVAIGLARLGHAVRFAGRVGADESGALVERTLRAEGVELALHADPDAATGLVLFEQRLPDLTRVEYHRAGSAGARLEPADLAAPLAAGARMLHVTGVTAALGPGPLDAVRRAVAHPGRRVCLDVNHRARLWSSDEAAAALTPLARRADVVIGSPEELELVGGVAALRDAGCEVVVKCGADGARAISSDGEHAAPGHRVGVVDSVGAGDAFTAGYLSALLDGLDVPGRLARGNAAGAFAVATRGDWEGLPTRAELDLLGLPGGAALR